MCQWQFSSSDPALFSDQKFGAAGGKDTADMSM
jgi:hypothetical protein